MAPILEVKGVEKRFAGLKALSNVDIEIQEGEIFGVVGPNGSGKTTLLNLITGFLKPTTGSILYKGKPITGLSPNLIAERRIARTFQLISVFPDLTAEESIIAGSHLRTNGSIWGSLFHTRGYRKEEARLKQKAVEILALVGVQAHGLVRNFGPGEQRKLEIAIALATEPELLLTDEPAAGLNPVEATELEHLIQLIHDMGITLVIVEHNMQVIIGVCNHLVVLDFGVKIADGTPKEIVQAQSVIKAYLGEHRNA